MGGQLPHSQGVFLLQTAVQEPVVIQGEHAHRRIAIPDWQHLEDVHHRLHACTKDLSQSALPANDVRAVYGKLAGSILGSMLHRHQSEICQTSQLTRSWSLQNMLECTPMPGSAMQKQVMAGIQNN